MQMNELTGKVAVVTGASKGIGAAIAKRFAAAGAAVVVNYPSSRECANSVVTEIATKGGKAIAVQGNVSNAVDITRLFAETIAKFGRVDILVNNAGVFAFAPLDGVTEVEFHREFDTNVLGTILATQEATRHFGPKGGSVINFSTIASVGAIPNSLVYAASKSAVDAVTRVLAAELAPKNIRVNAIAPGATQTEGFATMGGDSKDLENYMLAQIPMGRLGQPDDIAKVALFLASDQSAWVTGERIVVSGGQR
jgi:3-oxoacyl-[acyl-carrier protein] reductase